MKKIAFYTYGFGHLFVERLLHNKNFHSSFPDHDFIIITDNRTHEDFYLKKKWEVIYLADYKHQLQDIDVYKSDNFILAMKRYTILNLKAKNQEKIYAQMHHLVTKTLEEHNVQAVLFNQKIQCMEGALITQCAKALRIPTICPHYARLGKRSFLTHTEQEILPLVKTPSEEDNKKASAFLDHYLSAKGFIYPLEVIRPMPKEHKKNLVRRTLNFFKRSLIQGEDFEWPDFVYSVKENFPLYKKLKSKFNKRNSKKYFADITEESLPKKYIYFPLHVYPEASISIPAPFFKDQLRAIDLIRLNLPDDYQLLVKEHPSMIGKRPIGFYKQIQKMAGTRLLSPAVSSFKIIQQAHLVISITGTAAFEAFLLGRPSFSLANTFFASFINTKEINYATLNISIKEYMQKQITKEEILHALSLIYANTFDYYPWGVEIDYFNIVSEENVNAFSNAIQAYIPTLK